MRVILLIKLGKSSKSVGLLEHDGQKKKKKKKVHAITSKLLHFGYKYLLLALAQMDTTNWQSRHLMEALTNLPSAAPGHSCASSPVTMCPFFMGCHVVHLSFTLHVLSIIFSSGAEKQLKPLLTAANSATFPGCVLLPSARAKHGPSVPRRHSHSNYFSLPASTTWAHHLAASTQNVWQHRLDPRASAEDSLRRLLSPNPHISAPFFLSAPTPYWVLHITIYPR